MPRALRTFCLAREKSVSTATTERPWKFAISWLENPAFFHMQMSRSSGDSCVKTSRSRISRSISLCAIRSAAGRTRSGVAGLRFQRSLNQSHRPASHVGRRDAPQRHPGVAVELLDRPAALLPDARFAGPPPPSLRSARCRLAARETGVEVAAAGESSTPSIRAGSGSPLLSSSPSARSRSITRPARRRGEAAPHLARPVSPV